MLIVTISGLDGSGKSTQIQNIQKHFESLGKKVYYFHAVQFSLASFLAGKSNKKPGETKAVTKANGFQIFLRKLFLLIDIWRFKRFVKKLEKEKYDVLVSDRYFYDSVINILFLERQSLATKQFHPLRKGGLRRIISHSIPAPNTAIFLNVSPEEILRRERHIEQGIDYLKEKHRLYTQNLSSFHITSVNGEKDKQEVFEEVLSIIK